MNGDHDFRITRVPRRRPSLTLHALANRSGLTYPTVESAETDKDLPSLITLDAIAVAWKRILLSTVWSPDTKMCIRESSDWK
ncbi:MAG: helix-turn-helix transcriptional regulator [Sedimentisphaerales bacterium]|nr:helix-turn-helix transcriptional regulator [Sedimentisphaerales bacterium]